MTDFRLVPFLNWFHSNSSLSKFLSLLVFVCLKIWWWLVSAHNGFLFLCFYYNSPEVAFLTLLTHRPFICSTCGHQPPQQSSPVEQSFSSEQSFFWQSRVLCRAGLGIGPKCSLPVPLNSLNPTASATFARAANGPISCRYHVGCCALALPLIATKAIW